MRITVEIAGAERIGRALRELPNRIDRKILNAGLLGGAQLVRDEARKLAPVLISKDDPRWTPGALRKAIQAVAIRASDTPYAGEVMVYVQKLTKRQIASFKRRQLRNGLKANARLNPSDAFYWRFVEFGTAKMRARPFMRPAFESKKQQMVDEAMKIFEQRVQIEIDKLGRTFF